MAESTEDLLESLDKKYGELKLKPSADFDRDLKQAQAALQNLKKETKMNAGVKATPDQKTL